MNTTIRRLTPTDIDQYRNIMLEAYESHPEAFTSNVEERAALPVKWWYSRLNHSDNTSEMVIGALNKSELVGVVGVAFETRYKIRHKSHLFGMYVKPEARKHGIGKELVLAALSIARLHPYTTIMQLTVTDGNQAAKKLYESCGFTIFGVEPFAVLVGENSYVAKAHMWRNIQST